MPKYIGITIGPIYKTLMKAKKTRELFAASYIFSYIMKKIIIRFKDNTFILPHFDKDKIETEKYEIGIFPDRMIFKYESGDFGKLQNVIKEIIENTANRIFNHTTNRLSQEIAKEEDKSKIKIIENKLKRYREDDIIEFLNDYFQIYFCEIETDRNYNEVINEINSYLDTFELQQKFIPKEIYDYLSDFFFRVNHSFLMKDAFDDQHTTFKSIPEIATSELRINFKDYEKYADDDTGIYAELEERFKKDKNFKQYHKYIAIIGADADNMSKTINSLNSIREFNKLSENLFNFALDANKKIKDFGGATIYAGGDDLLFFAPIVGKDKRNFVQLIDELSREFHCLMQQTLGELPTYPTLSFGISIGYYKFPMNEALEISNSLLYLAKSMKERSVPGPDIIKKNSFAFRVLKHSGKYYESCFSFDSQEYSDIKKILCRTKAVNLPEKTINSLIYKLSQHKTMLMNIGSNKTRLENFFKNNFNEEIHKDTKQYISKISDFTYEMMVSKYYDKNNKNNDLRIEYICSVLRLLNFLQGGN